ncbi:PD-(D/E)XK motif protein [Vibrio fluvialis]|nr:PD-(D/E)XK motif protein [Vibrio fluvialis]EMA2479660.1 PD-(D/E)XK motif protein [Vibrio fluvialis]
MDNSPWKDLDHSNARRVNNNGQFDFFWVVVEEKMPALMLRLPIEPINKPKLPELKNLITNFRIISGRWAFVLVLKEKSQAELFETLCRDVVESGEKASNLDEALSRAIQRTKRWHHLLRSGRSEGLSTEEQRGLIGELNLLRELAMNFGSEMAVEAWKGPSGAPKDFELIGCCIEVKTRRTAATPSISISSADQLADCDGGRLFLSVTNVESAIVSEGMTLHDYVALTESLFQEDCSTYTKWEDAIYSTGYDPLNKYDDRCWLIRSTTYYEVLEGFPRINFPLPQGVQNVRYSISLDACEPFKINDNTVDYLREFI